MARGNDRRERGKKGFEREGAHQKCGSSRNTASKVSSMFDLLNSPGKFSDAAYFCNFKVVFQIEGINYVLP